MVPKMSKPVRPHIGRNLTAAPPPGLDRGQTLNILQVCERMQVSRRTVYNWMATGKIEWIRTAGGSVRVYEDTLWRGPHREQPPAVQHGEQPAPVK